MNKWIHEFAQTTTYLGVAVILIIWGGIFLLASQEHERDYRDAIRQGSNLTRVLEEYIRRVVKETDSALLTLRQSYQEDPQHFDIKRWVDRSQSNTELTLNFGIAGPDGSLLQSSLAPLAAPTYVGDRPHFKVQAESTVDQLHIGAPVVGKISGKLTIELTRRISSADGSFAGTVAASLDVQQLNALFGSLDIGQGGVVSLIGFDGIVRLRGTSDPNAPSFAGISVADSPLFRAFRQNPNGSYWNTAASSAKFDGVSRLISYRTVTGLPLIAVVGLTEESIFQGANIALQKYVTFGITLTAIVLIVMVFGADQKARISAATNELKRSKKSIEHTNLLLHTALKNMAHGLCMFDRDQRLVVCNDRYGEMYALTPEQTKPGTTLRSILQARVNAGVSPQDAEEYIRTRLQEVVQGNAYNVENQLSDGRVYAVNHQPMPHGGWVAIHQDITEYKTIQRALIASTDALKASNARFAAALQNMSHGLCMIDASQKLLVANERYRQIYNLPEELVQPGTTLCEILEFRAGSGNYVGPAPGEYIAAQLNNPTHIEKLGNGRVILILRHAMAEGCWLTMHEDITERWRNETRVSFLAHHDALTGLANRPALVEKIEDACARHRRWKEEFNVLMVDLDRFQAGQ